VEGRASILGLLGEPLVLLGFESSHFLFLPLLDSSFLLNLVVGLTREEFIELLGRLLGYPDCRL